MNAILLQPETEPGDDPDVDMERLRNIYRKIPLLSTTMVCFLSCNYYSDMTDHF